MLALGPTAPCRGCSRFSFLCSFLCGLPAPPELERWCRDECEPCVVLERRMRSRSRC